MTKTNDLIEAACEVPASCKLSHSFDRLQENMYKCKKCKLLVIADDDAISYFKTLKKKIKRLNNARILS